MPESAPPAGRRRRVTKRYYSDGWIAAVAIGVVMFASLFRATTLTDAERDVFESLNHLSDVLSTPVQAVMLLGVFAAVPAVAAVAMLFRRFRLATVLVSSGCLAYAIAKVAKPIVDAGRPLAVLPNADVIVRGSVAQGLGYPSGHAAVSAALAVAALPYLRGRYRWLVLLVPAMVGFGRIYVGAHLPLDVIGGWAIGVGSAFAIHLIAGRPPFTRDVDPERVEAEPNPLPASAPAPVTASEELG
jgi:membrane-associated phospholipid phosphatase